MLTEQSIKNYLGIAVIITILTLAVSAYSYVRSYGRSVDARSFTVSAEGKAIALPDVAKFSFSVITEGGKDLASLQKENTKKVNGAIDFILSHRVDKKDIKTTNYNVSPRYQYFPCASTPVSPVGDVKPCPPAEIVGYTISQNVEVKVRDFNVTGDVLAGIVEKGANSVSQLSFTVDDETKYLEEARKEAMEKARDQAKNIAKAGGFRLGRLVAVEEGGARPYYGGYDTFGYVDEKALDVAPAPRIEPGSNEIQVSVSLTYEIR